MKFDELRALFPETEHFDFSALLQLSGEPREQVRMQVHRWTRAGKLLRLRKGLYVFAERHRKRAISAPALAGPVYPPSYLSLHWALGFYGLIPEQVVTLTSVTTRQTNRFRNPLGSFDYRHIRAALFTGYRKVLMEGGEAWVASPEKALLDFWYLESGPWNAARMRQMRFQNFDRVDAKRLRDQASGVFRSPRIDAAVSLWLELAESPEEQGEEL